MQFFSGNSKTADGNSSSDSKLKVFLEGDIDCPKLELNGHEIVATVRGGDEPIILPLQITMSTDIHSVWNAIEFGSEGSSEFLHIKNCSAFANTIGVECIGPFTLMETHSSKPHSKKIQLSLKSHTSTVIKLSFRPSRKFGESFAAQSETSSISIDGSIILTFGNGYKAIANVKLAVALPLITVSAPHIDFGTCRIDDENIRGFILLSNPTNIKAVWKITHIPNTKDAAKASTPSAEFSDDPAVFIISPLSGEMEGPTVTADTATHAPPRDFNRR